MPSAKRCYAFGQAIGDAIRSWDSDKKVVVIGTGGFVTLLDGERAGFINKDFDLKFMESMVHDPAWATQFSIHELVEKTGTGVETLDVARRAAVPGTLKKAHSNYHIPISNTASGVDGAGDGGVSM